jgi:uncharacterized membrane protein YczE
MSASVIYLQIGLFTARVKYHKIPNLTVVGLGIFLILVLTSKLNYYSMSKILFLAISICFFNKRCCSHRDSFFRNLS